MNSRTNWPKRLWKVFQEFLHKAQGLWTTAWKGLQGLCWNTFGAQRSCCVENYIGATKACCCGKMFQDWCKMAVALKGILSHQSLMETCWNPVKQMLCEYPCQTQMINHASCIRLTVGRSAWSTGMTARVPVPQSGPASFSHQAPSMGTLSIWSGENIRPAPNQTTPMGLTPFPRV